jgi:hypothetical protein
VIVKIPGLTVILCDRLQEFGGVQPLRFVCPRAVGPEKSSPKKTWLSQSSKAVT